LKRSAATRMARLRKRVCLEEGLRLDLNQLIRDGTVVSGAVTSQTIFLQVAGSREQVGVAVITGKPNGFGLPAIQDPDARAGPND